jgi:nucleotide-binding universal stress UspA family protein
MTKTIVVPLDGSLEAESAIPAARWIAQRLDADLVLVMSTAVADTSVEEAGLAHAVERADMPVSEARLVTDAYGAGALAAALCEYPETVVCMATGPHGAVGAALPGSVANEVLGHTHLPVVLVGPSVDAGQDDGKVLLACLGSELEPGAAPTYLDLAAELSLDLHLVSVTHPSDGRPVPGERHHRAVRAAVLLDGGPCQVTGHDLVGPDVADQVVELARSSRAQLIALDAHTGDTAAQRPLGRIATRIVQEARCPVLVHRSPSSR